MEKEFRYALVALIVFGAFYYLSEVDPGNTLMPMQKTQKIKKR